MALNRVCLALLIVVCLESVAGKPFLGALWCDWFCDDYDDDVTTTTTTTADDYDYGFGCDDCRPRRRRTTTTSTASPVSSTAAGMPGVNPSQISFVAPPNSGGYTFMLTNNGNGWGIMMSPNQAPAGQATTTTVVTTTAASGSTAGGATTAGATTAAGGTTAAPGTTAAASTAAPGK